MTQLEITVVVDHEFSRNRRLILLPDFTLLPLILDHRILKQTPTLPIQSRQLLRPLIILQRQL